jgi:WD40 repeat protein
VVLDAAFRPDGRVVLVGCHDGNVSLWDALSGKRLRTLVEGPKYLARPKNDLSPFPEPPVGPPPPPRFPA